MPVIVGNELRWLDAHPPSTAAWICAFALIGLIWLLLVAPRPAASKRS